MSIPMERYIPSASRLILGCMGLGGGWNKEPYTAEHVKQAHEAVDAALEAGINFFDHADIYAYTKAEAVFGDMLRERPELREQIILQSKCGIRFGDGPRAPQRYDFSKEHIMASVDGTLKRLGIEQLDVLLLHRPDPLMEPEEVAEAFHALRKSGRVRHFGVSNMSAAQMAFLQSALSEPLVANQLELSLSRLDWLDSVVTLNQSAGTGVSFPEGTIEYCRMNGIQLQAWSPLSKGLFSRPAEEDQSENVRETAKLVQELAGEKGISTEAVVLAWLMRHPAGIQPVIGTVRPERIRSCAEAGNVELSREEWYALYTASRGQRMP